MTLWPLRLAVIGALLYYVIAILPVRELIGSMAAMPLHWYALSWGCLVLSHYVGATIQQALLAQQGLRLSTPSIFLVNLSALFYGLFLPGGTLAGSAVRWYRLARLTGKPVGVLTASVFSRLIEVLGLTVLALVFWLIAGRPGGAGLGLAVLACCAGTALLYVCVCNRRLGVGLALLLRRQKIARRRLRRVLLKILLAAQRHRSLSPSFHLRLLGQSLVRNLIGTFSTYSIALGLGLPIGFAELAWVRSAAVLAAMLPISFAGLGVREASYIVLLQLHGVTPVGAAALALLQFTVSVLVASLGGLVELTGQIRSCRSKSSGDLNGHGHSARRRAAETPVSPARWSGAAD